MSEGRIPAGCALALGVVQGPAELLPVSSSAHIVLVPWLAGWEWEEIDPELRKSFEVALHAGTAPALLLALRGEPRLAPQLQALSFGFDPLPHLLRNVAVRIERDLLHR